MNKAFGISPSLLAYGLLTITTLSWAGNTIASKLATGVISPFAVVSLRWAIVAPLATLISYQALKRDWPLIKSHIVFAFILGILGFSAFNSFFYVAAHHTQAINIGITQGAIPIFVLIMASLLFRVKPHPWQIIGFFITMIGVVTIVAGGDLKNLLLLNVSIGDLYMICACLCYALYATFLQKRPKVDLFAFFAIMAWSALLTSLPLLAFEWQTGSLIWPKGSAWLIIFYIAFLPSFLSQIFFLKGVDLIGASRAGVFVNLVPIFAAFLAVIILNEPFHFYHALALLLVLSGIALSEKAKA